MISYHYLCVFTRHSCILFTFVPISLMFVQWLHRFLRKWASRAFPASSRSAGARTLRCSWRPVKMGSRAGFLCLFGPRPGHCQFVFPTLTDERRVQAVYKGNNDGQLEEHTSQLVDFDFFVWWITFHQTLDVLFEIQVIQVLPPMFFASWRWFCSHWSRQEVALVQDITLASRAAVGALVRQSTNNVGRHVLKGWVGWCLDQQMLFFCKVP